MAEFTGERLVPGLVEADLYNEHIARYRFTARFARGARVLDAGCGAGYGTAQFEGAASVTGIDISADAIGHAVSHYARPGVRFLRADCEAFPFADASFDLVAAFEVVEHLERWERLLSEGLRVLSPGGLFVVSTPNKAFYTESRGAAGPNPFHRHEFEHAEFDAALRAVFPYVRLWTQNHSEAILFAPVGPSGATLEVSGDPAPETASFFLAVCGREPIAANDAFAWVPRSANLLRERERHIVKLEEELAKKDAWLARSSADLESLQISHEATLAELVQRNDWAEGLNREVERAAAAIRELQDEAAARARWIDSLNDEIDRARAEFAREADRASGLERDLVARTEWARSIEADLDQRTRHVTALQLQVEEHEAHLGRQRDLLARRAGEIARLQTERRVAAESKWMRLGRKFNLGPRFDLDDGAPEGQE